MPVAHDLGPGAAAVVESRFGGFYLREKEANKGKAYA